MWIEEKEAGKRKNGAQAFLPESLYEAKIKGNTCVVEYEPDSELRDFEQIPLLEEGGIEAFIRREVLPYTPDLPALRPTPGQFCVYVLKCADDSFYIGQTDNFARRLIDGVSPRGLTHH